MVQALYISPRRRQSSTVFHVAAAGEIPYYWMDKILRNLPVRDMYEYVWPFKIRFIQVGITVDEHMRCQEGPSHARLGIACTESV
jgi:hypothetical protein